MVNSVISVIIPVYNGEVWIKRCIDSLLNQNSQSLYQLEIIIIDDGSIDNTAIIAEDYQKAHNEIRVFNTENRGVSEARNTGISVSTGDYITFVDADDYVDSDYFEKLMEGITKDIDIVCGGYKAEYEDSVISKMYPANIIEGKENILRTYLKGNQINVGVCSKVYKSSIAKRVTFDSRYRIGEDKLFLFECFGLASKIKTSSSCGYHYVINQSSVMREKFTEKKLDGLFVSEEIRDFIVNNFPNLTNEVESWLIDVKCRTCSELYTVQNVDRYKKVYTDLLKDIHSYSIIKKAKYSSWKHFIAFLIMRESPPLYHYLKNETKMEFR